MYFIYDVGNILAVAPPAPRKWLLHCSCSAASRTSSRSWRRIRTSKGAAAAAPWRNDHNGGRSGLGDLAIHGID